MAESKRIVLCLDGTWNNPYTDKARDDGTRVFRPTNTLKLARAVLPIAPDGTAQLTYYQAGVGALGSYPGTANRLLRMIDKNTGGLWGAGFETNVERAVTFLANNFVPGDQVFVFGFSRGAAQAQAVTRFLDWMGGIPTKGDAYFVPLYFQDYIRTAGGGDPASVRTAKGAGPDEPLSPVLIEMLGVFDTVMALGSRLGAARRRNQKQAGSFHVGRSPAVCVRNARQALAIDERRYDFRPEIWTERHENQSLEQRWFAGVHSNVGGGYVHDGLANLPLGWIASAAAERGLALDNRYLSHFRPYPQDRLYDSRSLKYRAFDFVRFRRGKGRRVLAGMPNTAHFTLDKSVIHRVRADASDPEFDRLDKYRPKNLADFLKSLPDIDGYLRALGFEEGAAALPAGFL